MPFSYLGQPFRNSKSKNLQHSPGLMGKKNQHSREPKPDLEDETLSLKQFVSFQQESQALNVHLNAWPWNPADFKAELECQTHFRILASSIFTPSMYIFIPYWSHLGKIDLQSCGLCWDMSFWNLASSLWPFLVYWLLIVTLVTPNEREITPFATSLVFAVL